MSRPPAEVVSRDQRRRLLRSVVAVVAAEGLAGARVRDVLRGARVSQKTLYEQFAGVSDLLLAACDAWLAELLDDVEGAVAGRPGWADGVGDGLRCLVEGVVAQPELARCCFVELCAVGAAGEECRLRALGRLATTLRPGSGDRLNPLDELLAGGVWHALGAAILSGRTRSVVSLLPDLQEFALACAGSRSAV